MGQALRCGMVLAPDPSGVIQASGRKATSSPRYRGGVHGPAQVADAPAGLSSAATRLRRSEVYLGDTGAHGPQSFERNRSMLGIAAAVLFFIAFLINAAEITTNDVFSSSNVMLLGLMLLALHVAGIGSGWSGRRR